LPHLTDGSFAGSGGQAGGNGDALEPIRTDGGHDYISVDVNDRKEIAGYGLRPALFFGNSSSPVRQNTHI
jgi:hypothetical protein